METQLVARRPMASARGGAAVNGSSAFARNVSALLERTDYRRCETGEDFEEICRLRYKAYRVHGLVSELPDETFSDVLDETPNCYRFGMFIDGMLVSTVRVHHLTRTEPFSPAMTVFKDVLEPRLARGDTFIDPSRLAADPDWTSTYRALPYLTLRLAVIASTYFKTTSCLSMIRDEHSAFYHRVFNSVQLGDPRPYTSVNVLAILYESVCATNLGPTIQRFPFFKSTPMEQRMLFAKAAAGEPAPLTVLPTAKYMADAA